MTKVCALETCGRALSPRNRCGYCKAHRSKSESQRTYKAQHHAANRQRYRLRIAAHYAANRERYASRDRRRRARQKELFMESPKRSHVWARTGGVCHLCLRPVPYDSDWHGDHVFPLALQGVEALDNLAPAHRGCNTSKSATFVSAIPWVEQAALDVCVLFHLGPAPVKEAA